VSTEFLGHYVVTHASRVKHHAIVRWKRVEHRDGSSSSTPCLHLLCCDEPAGTRMLTDGGVDCMACIALDVS
jgi:hypothetical protein